MLESDNFLQDSQLEKIPVEGQLLTEMDAHTLVCRARHAWQKILVHLRPQYGLISSLVKGKRKAVLHESWCEHDVVLLLIFLEEEGNKPGQWFNREAHCSLVRQVRTELACFRVYRDEIVRRNLGLVLTLARYYQSPGLGQLELVQEGVLGLMRAIEKFDPERGVKFCTYAVWWIRQAIVRALRRTEEIVHVSSYSKVQQHRLLRLRQRLEQKLSRAPTQEELQGVAKGRVTPAALDTIPVSVVSLDAAMEAGDDRPLEEIVPDCEVASPEQYVLKADMTKKLRQALALLASQDAQVLQLRFGLEEDRVCTLEEVGQRLGMSKEQVRQREERALLRLRMLCQRAGISYDCASWVQ